MIAKEIVAFIDMGIDCMIFAIYIRAVIKKVNRPHAFTWLIWGISQFIGGAAQLAKGGGVGAWPIIFGALFCLVVAGLAALYHGERNITRGDWVAFLGALSAIPLWLITGNPLWAAIVITGIDGIGGFYPTFRKSWGNPYEENLLVFVIATLGWGLSIFALESYSLTTTLYPAVLTVMHIALSAMLVLRRRGVAKKEIIV